MNDTTRTGVYLIGACGAVATTCVVGATVLGRGLAQPTGMVTALADFDALGLADPGQLVFGGCEIRRTSPLRSAEELCGPNGFLQPAHVEIARDVLEELNCRLDPGLLCPSDQIVSRLEPQPRQIAVQMPSRAVELITANLEAFRREADLTRVIVVNLASTESYVPDPPHYNSLSEFQRKLDSGHVDDFSPSVLYAYAALKAGCAFLNFTPSPGSSIPALIELANQIAVPHMGRDGKTGETLLKTTLAPMFVARNLKVLSWEGHNILGNRDGRVLEQPGTNQAKQASKGEALDAILRDPDLHSRVRIDYVPSLADWKTAWDFIHFEGFLGTRMILQLIWQGCDSILAAPLVIDMIRLLDHSLHREQGGLQPQLACFFKSPTSVNTHAFPEQFAMLERYVRHEASVAGGVPERA